MKVFVVGRFPPPLDGQTLATERLAELLHVRHEVLRLNTEPPMSEFVENKVALRPSRVRHFLRLRPKVRAALEKWPSAPVFWASISPALLGHWRDVLSTIPAFQPGQPVYGVVHRATFDRLFRSPMTRASARGLVRRLQAFVFLNPQLSNACAEWIPEQKRIVVPNTIDQAVYFSETDITRKREARRSGDALKLLFLSNMIPLKGYMDVLRAVALLRDGAVPVEGHFAGRWGSEQDRRAFERVVSEDSLEETVMYHGGVEDRNRVRSLYAIADVFVLPSYHPTEAQPLALIEALNAGIPVITTNHGGIPFIVRDGAEGLFVPPRNPKAIADAVVRLQNYDVWRDLSEAARRRFFGVFARDVVRRQWEELLEETVSTSGPWNSPSVK